MKPFTIEDFKKLAHVKEETCVSIYIPAHRGGQEVLKGNDRLKLKSHIQKTENRLKEKQVNAQEIEALLEPAKKLEQNDEFWRYQSDGLALFLSKDFDQHYTLPLTFEDVSFIGKRFYLKPLLPLLSNNKQFWILNISRKKTQLFKATEYSIDEVKLDDYGPTSMEEVLKLDDPENQIQQHTGAGKTERAMTHGHGEGKDIKHRLVRNYMSKLDNAVMDLTNDRSSSLLLAGVEELTGHYREVSKYPHILEKSISGNHERTNISEVLEEAVKILKPYFEKELHEKAEKFKALQGTGKAESAIESVIKNAVEGMVDQLFIANKKEVWGQYDSKNHIVKTRKAQLDGDEELLNYAAIQTILKGGNAYLVEPEKMPADHAPIAAIYRNA